MLSNYQPKPKQGIKRFSKFILYIFLMVVILVGWSAWLLIKPANTSSDLVNFSVAVGEDVKIIGTNLDNSQLISSRFIFESWVYLTGTEIEFLAGNYKLPANSNIINIIKLLTGGIVPSSEVNITIIEGWSIKDISEYLAKIDLYQTDDFMKLATTPQLFNPILDSLGMTLSSKPAGASLEGYLFPDTYRVYQQSKPQDLVSKVLDNFVKKFKQEWLTQLEKKGYNMWQAIIMASIVEKEVASEQDRQLVADIFWRRLEASWGLEADSTINYITGKNSPRASGDDLSIDSPYNTYKYRGLPPGPICNPGETALYAVVYPQSNNYWYFLTTPDGEVIYSKTFEEHKKAKAQYLK
ncbi:MAG: endolytic transglycosylase MltG [Patescibacteria group bacterium]